MDKKEIYLRLRECQKILTEELPTLPICTRVDVSTVRKDLVGFKPTGTSTAITWNIQNWYFETLINK
jgi:ABC-type transport system substrate-binding protein